MRQRIAVVIVACAAGFGIPAGSSGQDSDEKLAQRMAAIDKKLVKACEELAVLYDKEGDVEAASFFAECAIGFGSTNEKAKGIKVDGEVRVYLGKLRGGKVLEKTSPIRSKLDAPASDYKKILEEISEKWQRKRSTVTEGEMKIFRDCLVKYEISQRAQEYVKATQRVNDLRQKMGLRAVLWDFENSRKLILGAGAIADVICEFGMKCPNHEDCKKKIPRSIYYDPEIVKVIQENYRGFIGDLKNWVEELRGHGLWRMGLLNANARRLWLGHWNRLDDFTAAVAYNIPQQPYREDIPTPTQRHERGTVVQDWVDTEETFEVRGKKLPLVRYPCGEEIDVPWRSAGVEEGWKSNVLPDNCGVPITIRFFGKATLTEIAATLLTKSGSAVAIRVYTNGDGNVEAKYEYEWPTVLLVPNGYLEKGATYTIGVRCKVDGVPFEKTWSFTTRRK